MAINDEPGRRNAGDGEGAEQAQDVALVLAVAVAVAAFVIVLAAKGVAPALIAVVLVVFGWAHVADLIPTRRELDALRAEPGPRERTAVIVMAGAGIVIGLGFLLFGRG